MLTQVAQIITDNIDQIVRRWVDDLRLTDRTEIHKSMLTSEIVDSMKAMLGNIAAAIADGSSSGVDTIPISLIPMVEDEAQGSIRTARMMGTKPLSGPIFAARQAARASGKLRHSQGYGVHEVVFEYIRLRQLIWATLRESGLTADPALSLDLPLYVDRMLDEVMTSAIESFHEVSVRDLEKRAVRDPLTQLYNKDFFQHQIHVEMRRALRYGEPLTLVMLDMDLLKTVNDTYGHQAGDAVIMAVGKTICDSARQPDIPCRYGGDEFAVILPETTKQQAMVFAERVLREMAALTIVVAPPGSEASKRYKTADSSSHGYTTSNLPLTIPAPTMSIGLASFPEDGRNPETLIAKADSALYRAKGGGRNRIAL